MSGCSDSRLPRLAQLELAEVHLGRRNNYPLGIEAIDLGIAGLENIERIGSGGNAVVYRARQPELDRSVVVKVLTSVDGETTRRRFNRERRAMGRLSQASGIAPLYGTGFTPAGQPYLLMPFYERGSLQEQIEQSGALAPAAVRDIGVAVANAVHTAHENGVLHRDIKPANILMSKTGRPDVADFGIARLVDDALGTTQALTMTPLYTAPEVFDGVDSGALSDVYSLGATLFALLNGYPAYGDPEGGTPVLSLMRRINEDPLPALPASVPDALRHAIARAMSKNPHDRQPTAAALAAELSAADMAPPAPKLGRRTRATKSPKQSTRNASTRGSAGSAQARSQRAPKRRRSGRRLIAGVLVALAALGAGVFAAFQFTADPTASDAPTTSQGPDDEQSGQPTPTAITVPSGAAAVFDESAASEFARQAVVRVESFSCAGAEISTGVRLGEEQVVVSADVLATPWQIEVTTREGSATATPSESSTLAGMALLAMDDPSLGEPLPLATATTGDAVAFVGRDGRPAFARITGDADGMLSVELDDGVDEPVEPFDAVIGADGLVGVAVVSEGSIEVATVAELQAGTAATAPVWGCESPFRSLTNPESAVAPHIEELLTLQQLSNAYANDQWPVVRAMEPARRTMTDAQFIVGWRPLQRGYVYPVSRTTESEGVVSWRLGLIGHETWNSSDLTTLFCVTWELTSSTGSITQIQEDAITIFGSLPGTARQSGFVDPAELRPTIEERCA